MIINIIHYYKHWNCWGNNFTGTVTYYYILLIPLVIAQPTDKIGQEWLANMLHRLEVKLTHVYVYA